MMAIMAVCFNTILMTVCISKTCAYYESQTTLIFHEIDYSTYLKCSETKINKNEY